MRRSFGQNDGKAVASDKGWSSLPCKHFYRIKEDVPDPAAATIIDDGLNANNISITTAIITNNTLGFTSGDTDDGTPYDILDADDVVIITSGLPSGADARFVWGGTVNNGITIANQDNGGVTVLDTTLGSIGVLFGTNSACLRICTLRRSTGVANFYFTESASDVITESVLQLTGISGSFASQVGLPQPVTNSGYAIMAFADGSMPSDEQLIVDFNQINQTWRLPNRKLPAGWTDKYAFA